MSMVAPWAVGEGILIYRSVKKAKRPPLPAELIGVSVIFVALSLMEETRAAPLAITLAWGLDIAAFMSLYSGPNAIATKAVNGLTGGGGKIPSASTGGGNVVAV